MHSHITFDRLDITEGCVALDAVGSARDDLDVSWDIAKTGNDLIDCGIVVAVA